jgi:hypothetical protein
MTTRENVRRLSFAILLCLCVLMQMLGVPATLWDPGDSFDIVESVLEGWSIHAQYTLLPPGSRFRPIPDTRLMLRGPILAGALFRPPLS